jgi:hypothetical protein
LVLLLAVTALVVLPASCGKEGPPVVPEPRGPLPSGALSVRQLGSGAEVTAAVPPPRGPLPHQTLTRAELLRVDFPPGAKPPADPGVFGRRGSQVAAADGPFQAGARVPLADSTLSAFDPLEGRLVRYAVRWRDAKGRPSPLAVAPDLVLASPSSPPTNVVAGAVPGGVRVSWGPPPQGAPAGYNVYRAVGEEPLPASPLNVEPLKETSFVDTDVNLGTRYRYVVRTLAAAERPPRESDSSQEASVLAADRFAPEPPRDLVAVREASQVRVFWTPGSETDLAGYRVQRRAGDGPWDTVADGLTQAQWLDPAPPAGTLAYRVLALDRADPPNVSEPTEPVEIAAPVELEGP